LKACLSSFCGFYSTRHNGIFLISACAVLRGRQHLGS
jgi:hypothetical protein